MPHSTLTDAETRDLRTLVGLMIPANTKYAVPGADDDAIFADIVKSLGRDTEDARTVLHQLAGLSGEAFAEKAATLKQQGGEPLFALNRVVLLCYYRDDRIMRSLGQEPRPPFPKGHVVEQGDWSLLDPVKKRAPMWRQP